MDMRTDLTAVPHAGLSEKTLGNKASKGKVKLEAIARSWRPSPKFGGQSTEFTASMCTASSSEHLCPPQLCRLDRNASSRAERTRRP